MQTRTIVSGQTTYYESETKLEYAQFDAECKQPVLAKRDFIAQVQRTENGSLLLRPVERSRKQRSRAITLWRGRKSCISKCLDRTHRLTFIVPDGELEDFCRYLMEDTPRAISFMYNYLKKTRGDV